MIIHAETYADTMILTLNFEILIIMCTENIAPHVI
jgi:hypothetical protein